MKKENKRKLEYIYSHLPPLDQLYNPIDWFEAQRPKYKDIVIGEHAECLLTDGDVYRVEGNKLIFIGSTPTGIVKYGLKEKLKMCWNILIH